MDNIANLKVSVTKDISEDKATPPTMSPPVVPPPESSDETEEYLGKFSLTQQNCENMSKCLALLRQAPHDQARIELLSQYVFELQSHNEMLCELLIDMNNVLGK